MIQISDYGFKYLLVGEQDRNFGLWVNTVGFQSISKGENYPLNGHPSGYYFNIAKGRTLREYQLLYITQGEGYFESTSIQKVKIEKGSLIMLFPNQWHTYSPSVETGWNEYYIGFEGPIIDRIIKSGFFSKESPVMNIGFHENIVNLYSRTIEVAKEGKMASQQYLAGLVLHMLGKIMSISKNNELVDDESSQKIEQAKIIMNENIYKDLDTKEIAVLLNVSYSWFRKIFKTYTGYAPAQYFMELKINKAKELLAETSLSVKEITFQLNFNSPEHFFSLFKRKTGFTPISYRNYRQ